MQFLWDIFWLYLFSAVRGRVVEDLSALLEVLVEPADARRRDGAHLAAQGRVLTWKWDRKLEIEVGFCSHFIPHKPLFLNFPVSFQIPPPWIFFATVLWGSHGPRNHHFAHWEGKIRPSAFCCAEGLAFGSFFGEIEFLRKIVYSAPRPLFGPGLRDIRWCFWPTHQVSNDPTQINQCSFHRVWNVNVSFVTSDFLYR